MSISTCIILIVIGILAGILSGVVGVGGGLIIIPLLIILLGLSQHEAQGTSLAVMLPPIGILAAINVLDVDTYQFMKGFKMWFKPWDAWYGIIKGLSFGISSDHDILLSFIITQ